jgi:predicted RNase H-like HicB family nuclease
MLVQIKIFRDEDGVWCASEVDHGIHTQGKTLDELFTNIEEATQLHFEEELAAGKTVDLLIVTQKEFEGAPSTRR